MKKIFTLLVLLMTTLCVSAQQYYKGTFHSKLNEFSDYETTVAVTQGEGGKYTLVFESIIFGNDDFGKCTFAGIENYKWAGGGSFTFSNEGGNLGAATKSSFELSDYSGKSVIDDEKIYLTFRFFQVNTTKEYRNVVFEGTRTSSGGGGSTGGDDKPTITATEQFTADVVSVFEGGQAGNVKYPNVVAKVCEWSDKTHSIEIAHIDTEKGAMSGVLLKGLEKKTVDGEVTYTGVVEPEITDLPNFYDTYVNLKANVEARIDEGGDLYATIVFTDESEPSFKLTAWFNYVEPFVPSDPFSVDGTLVGYTFNDGDQMNNKQTTLTFTETAKDVYTLSLTNVAIPNGVDLGTVSFEGVQRTGSDSEASFASKKGECKTTAAHPLYTELPYTDFEFIVGFDAEKKVTSCTGKFVIDNYDEAVSYTFNFTPTETSVNTVVAADGTVKHIYTLTGAKVTSLQRGVNIVRTADGRTLKVLKK